ncbi:segregation and condensation protein A [bacterium BMS3Abin05]|nr:segregation and condensation protein A [bacterium BMS3Abin05]GBE26192.1 segregation and condensation protein A [bacterium BMS3Bbin03]HDZ12223.1 hypothetical protein [Bacteroidota bacterium]
MYKIRLQNFEGPLDLLLFLINKNEVDIYDIPIALITKQYLETIQLMQQLDLDVAGEFIVMAATLMHIKAHTLIPETPMFEAEDMVDPRQELVDRLIEYRKYKEIAHKLGEKESRSRTMVAKIPQEYDFGDFQSEETLPGTVTIFDLVYAFNQALKRFRERPDHHVITEQVSVDEQIEYVKHFMAGREQVSFRELIEPLRDKMILIATFLALLEMIKASEIRVKQPAPFSEIWIFKPYIQN